MGIWIAIAGVLGYLVLFVDGKEFSSVMREGGWASIAFFCLIGVGIYLALCAAPEVAQQAHGIHH